MIVDTEYLKTLEQRQINSGYCEIFKHSLISKENSKFEYLMDCDEINFSLDIIINSINIKNNFVVEDKYEKKLRKGLNFGHTIGHAIETHFMSSDKKLLHGEAIAICIIIESYISQQIYGFDIEKVDKIKNHLLTIFPKVKFNSSSINNIIKVMEHDKKNKDKQVNFILLADIGKLIFDVNVPKSTILKAFEYYSE